MAAKEQVASWLGDAHALADAQIKTLERMLEDLAGNYDSEQKLKEHLKSTEEQKSQLEHYLAELGGQPSGVKSLLTKLPGAVQGMGLSVNGDVMLKDMILLQASEHFEQASYESLRTAAERLENQELASFCQDQARQAADMANWAMRQIGPLTNAMLEEADAA